jgi:GNAT superfamily N-acetyltransferase
MNPKIILNDSPGNELIKVLSASIVEFNETGTGRPYDGLPLAISVAHPETDELLGGLWASTAYDYLHIDALYLHESLRRRGLGRQLIRQAEVEAIRRGCTNAYLDTFSFQARGFYEKLGYDVFGALQDFPKGHTRFFMAKLLKPVGSTR